MDFIPLHISTASIKEKVRTNVISRKRKFDTNSRINKLYSQWSSGGDGAINMYNELLYEMYNIYKPRIMSVAKKYHALSPVFDEEDLCQVGLIAINQALRKYDPSEKSNMKFSTYLEWAIRNVFQRTIGNKDKYVEIYTKDDELYKTMDYHDFQSEKKGLLASGYRYITKTRLCYLSDALKTTDNEPCEAALCAMDYIYTDIIDRDDEEAKETNINAHDVVETEDGAGDSEGVPERKRNTFHERNNANGKENLQLIDAAYRLWEAQKNGHKKSRHEHTLQKMFELYLNHGKAVITKHKPQGMILTEKEIERTLLHSISSSMVNYEKDSVPGSRFSFYLELMTRRTAQKIGADSDRA